MPDREVRTVLRRLAEGVAEAHRVGLAVGGLSPDNVVLRPNGLVGLRAVPAATGTIDGDIAALGALLEACLTGLAPTEGGPGRSRPVRPAGPRPPRTVHRAGPGPVERRGDGLPARRASAHRPGQRLELAPAPHGAAPRRHRQRVASPAPGAPARGGAVAPVTDGEAVRMDPETMPPVPQVRPVTGAALPPAALGGDTIDAGRVAPRGAYAVPPVAPTRRPRRSGPGATRTSRSTSGLRRRLWRLRRPPTGDTDLDDDEDGARRHRFVVIGLPLLALAVVVALAWWVGTTLLDVTDSVDEVQGSDPVGQRSGLGRSAGAPRRGEAVPIAGGDVFDPQGDGDPDNPDDVALAFDGDASTAWSTLEYRGSPAFGNLKDGVGLLLTSAPRRTWPR